MLLAGSWKLSGLRTSMLDWKELRRIREVGEAKRGWAREDLRAFCRLIDKSDYFLDVYVCQSERIQVRVTIVNFCV